jgi:hypothetical protein
MIAFEKSSLESVAKTTSVKHIQVSFLILSLPLITAYSPK